MDQEQQRQREQVLANAIRDGLENQRREREENRRTVAELTLKLSQATVKSEVKTEVQQAVVAVQEVVRIVIRDDAAPAAHHEQRRAPRIIRRDFANTAKEEEETTHRKRKGRDDDDSNTIGGRLFNGYIKARTFFLGEESTDKSLCDWTRKMLKDNQP
jgi:3-oxoacyl-ACP reductase-like protein